MSYAELHFHLLPGIDDGPSSLEESVELAAAAAAQGTGTIVTTPHVHPEFVTDVSSLPDRVREVVAKLAARRIPVGVLCGGELAQEMVPRLSQEELETIAQGPRAGGGCCSRRRWPGSTARTPGGRRAARARLRGRRRPSERALRWSDAGWETLEHELAAGSVVQINAWSVAGLYGEMVRATALWLLRTACAGGDRLRRPRWLADAGARARARCARRRARPGPAPAVDAVPNGLLELGLAVGSNSLAA